MMMVVVMVVVVVVVVVVVLLLLLLLLLLVTDAAGTETGSMDVRVGRGRLWSAVVNSPPPPVPPPVRPHVLLRGVDVVPVVRAVGGVQRVDGLRFLQPAARRNVELPQLVVVVVVVVAAEEEEHVARENHDVVHLEGGWVRGVRVGVGGCGWVRVGVGGPGVGVSVSTRERAAMSGVKRVW